MKGQWGLLFAFILVFIVAIFAVINVNPVTVDYLFGTAQWPLVLVILASALFGALILGSFGIFRLFRLRRENRKLQKEIQTLHQELQTHSEKEEVFPEEVQKSQEVAEKALHPEHPEPEESESPKA